MPTGNYSYSGSNEQRPASITEPNEGSGRFRPGASEEESGVFAKEPDRQTTTRGGQSSRGRSATMEEDDDQTSTQSRGRGTAQRGSARRGAQARRATERTSSARRSAAPETKGRQKKSRRGFAAMSPEQQREIARKGGLTVSRNRRHMADIGRVGGEHSHGGRRARR